MEGQRSSRRSARSPLLTVRLLRNTFRFAHSRAFGKNDYPFLVWYRRKMYRRRSTARRGYRRRVPFRRAYGGTKRRGSLYRRRKAKFKNLMLQAGLVNWKMKMTFDLRVDSNGVFKIGLNYNGAPNSTAVGSTMVLTYDNTGATVGHAFTDTLDSDILDQVRCAGISLKFIPSFPNGAIQLTSGYQPFAIIYDRDGVEETFAAATFDDILQQVHRSKVKNIYKPWKTFHKSIKYGVYTKIPTPTESGSTIEPNRNLWGMWHRSNTASAQTTSARGRHCMIVSKALDTTAFPTGSSLGTIVCTGYFQYKDRR